MGELTKHESDCLNIARVFVTYGQHVPPFVVDSLVSAIGNLQQKILVLEGRLILETPIANGDSK